MFTIKKAFLPALAGLAGLLGCSSTAPLTPAQVPPGADVVSLDDRVDVVEKEMGGPVQSGEGANPQAPPVAATQGTDSKTVTATDAPNVEARTLIAVAESDEELLAMASTSNSAPVSPVRLESESQRHTPEVTPGRERQEIPSLDVKGIDFSDTISLSLSDAYMLDESEPASWSNLYNGQLDIRIPSFYDRVSSIADSLYAGLEERLDRKLNSVDPRFETLRNFYHIYYFKTRLGIEPTPWEREYLVEESQHCLRELVRLVERSGRDAIKEYLEERDLEEISRITAVEITDRPWLSGFGLRKVGAKVSTRRVDGRIVFTPELYVSFRDKGRHVEFSANFQPTTRLLESELNLRLTDGLALNLGADAIVGSQVPLRAAYANLAYNDPAHNLSMSLGYAFYDGASLDDDATRAKSFGSVGQSGETQNHTLSFQLIWFF